MSLWAYDAWPSRVDQDWGQAERGDSPWDNLDFHVDLGCGKVPKARIGVDRYAAPGVAVIADLDELITYTLAKEPGESAPAIADIPFGNDELTEKRQERFADQQWSSITHMGALPFEDSSIKSIISHHCFEHIGGGFIPLMGEIYRVLEPSGVLRAITPLFPSWSAVQDPDHKRYFMASGEGCTWDAFCGTPDDCWQASFAVPYTKARFERVDMDYTPPVEVEKQWTPEDARELRVALVAQK